MESWKNNGPQTREFDKKIEHGDRLRCDKIGCSIAKCGKFIFMPQHVPHAEFRYVKNADTLIQAF